MSVTTSLCFSSGFVSSVAYFFRDPKKMIAFAQNPGRRGLLIVATSCTAGLAANYIGQVYCPYSIGGVLLGTGLFYRTSIFPHIKSVYRRKLFTRNSILLGIVAITFGFGVELLQEKWWMEFIGKHRNYRPNADAKEATRENMNQLLRVLKAQVNDFDRFRCLRDFVNWNGGAYYFDFLQASEIIRTFSSEQTMGDAFLLVYFYVQQKNDMRRILPEFSFNVTQENLNLIMDRAERGVFTVKHKEPKIEL